MMPSIAGTGRNARRHLHPRHRRYMRLLAGASSAAIALASTAFAASGTWDAHSGGTWSSGNNWTSRPDFPNGPWDVASFPASDLAQAVAVDGAFTLGWLNVDGPSSYTITGTAPNGLTFDASSGLGSITVNNINGNAAHRISAPLTLASSIQLTNRSTKSFTIAGPVGGPGGITVDSPGAEIYLYGANTYAGPTLIRNGTLTVTNPAGLGSADVGTIVQGGTLKLMEPSLEPITVTRAPNGTAGTLQLHLGYNQTLSTPVTLSGGTLISGVDVDAIGTLCTPVILTGKANTILNDSQGRLVLSGGTTGTSDLTLAANVYRGGITISGPLAHSGRTVVDSTSVRFASPNTLQGELSLVRYGSSIVLDADVSAPKVNVFEGNVIINAGNTLSTPSSIMLNTGSIKGALAAPDIAVTGYSSLSNLGDAFTGTITIHAGRLSAGAQGLGSPSTGTSIVAPTGAFLALSADSAEPIAINNAVGLGWGALVGSGGTGTVVTHTGPLSLGESGAVVGTEYAATLALAGPISGGSLTIAHNNADEIGTVRIAGSSNTYTGSTRVLSHSILALAGAGRLASTSDLQLIGGSLRIEPAAAGTTDRIADSIPISMAGGSLVLADPAPEAVGEVTLAQFANEIGVAAPGASLTLASLKRQGPSLAHFTASAGQLGGGAPGDGRITMTAAPALKNGIMGGWATVGTDFATYGDTGVSACTAYVSNIKTADAAANVSLTASAALASANAAINSLRLPHATTLDLGGKTLTIDSGGIIAYVGTSPTRDPALIQNGTLIPGPSADGQLIFHTFTTYANTLSVAATVADAPGTRTTLILSGGYVHLAGANTHTGGTILDRSVVTLDTTDALPAGSDLTLNEASLSIPASSSPLQLADVRMTGKSSLSSSSLLDARSWTVEDGSITAPLTGSAPMIKNGTGDMNLNVGEKYTGTIDINCGTLVYRRAAALGTGLVRVNGAGTLYRDRGSPETGGAVIQLNGGKFIFDNFGGVMNVTAPSTVDFGDNGSAWSMLGTLNIARNASLRNGSELTFVIQGDLSIDGQFLAGPTSSCIITPAAGKTVSGSGSIDGIVQIMQGGILSPGHTAGRLTVSGTTYFGAKGVYQWEIAHATGTAGVDWDLLDTSVLGIGATNVAPFTIRLSTLPGGLDDFDPGREYAWALATSENISGFSADRFLLDSSGFSNDLGGGHFFLTQSGNELYLNFAPVPEPAAIALFASAAPMLLRRRRK